MLENVVKKVARGILAVLDLHDILGVNAVLEFVVKKVKREILMELVHRDS